MKKLLLVSLLMSGPAAFSMEVPKELLKTQKTHIVRNRHTATVAGHRDAIMLMTQRLDILGEELWADQINLLSALPSNADEWKQLFATVGKIDSQALFDELKVKVFDALGDVDPEIYEPLYQFGAGVVNYLNRFMECTTDEEVKNLLKDIEENKDKIVNSFNQCAPIVIKLGHVCVKAALNHCLQIMPNDYKAYLPLAASGAQLALITVRESYGDISLLNISELPDITQYLHKLMGYLSKGYLTSALAGVETFGSSYVTISPKIRRSVFFVEQCAKIFLPTQRQERVLKLLCSPNAKIEFPLNDGYFKNASFKDVCRNAFDGDLVVIKNFAEVYPDLLRKEDETKQNVLAFAITGFCSGKDAAWKVIKYLLEQDSMITEKTFEILKAPSVDKDLAIKQDRDLRKKQVALLIAERSQFFIVHKDDFYECPEKPLVIRNEQPQGSCIIS